MPADRHSGLVDRAYDVGAFAVAAPPEVRNRRGTILTMGIIQIVLGSICGVGALIMLLTIPTPLFGKLALAVIYGPPTLNLLVTGIGSVKVARWARRATLISAGIWLGLGSIVTVGLLIVTFAGVGVGQGEAGLLRFAMAPMLLTWLALPIVLIVLYTRPAVRATFERRAG